MLGASQDVSITDRQEEKGPVNLVLWARLGGSIYPGKPGGQKTPPLVSIGIALLSYNN